MSNEHECEPHMVVASWPDEAPLARERNRVRRGVVEMDLIEDADEYEPPPPVLPPPVLPPPVLPPPPPVGGRDTVGE